MVAESIVWQVEAKSECIRNEVLNFILHGQASRFGSDVVIVDRDLKLLHRHLHPQAEIYFVSSSVEGGRRFFFLLNSDRHLVRSECRWSHQADNN